MRDKADLRKNNKSLNGSEIPNIISTINRAKVLMVIAKYQPLHSSQVSSKTRLNLRFVKRILRLLGNHRLIYEKGFLWSLTHKGKEVVKVLEFEPELRDFIAQENLQIVLERPEIEKLD